MTNDERPDHNPSNVTLQAVCQAYWGWQSFDAAELWRLAEANGLFSEQSTQRIAQNYRVRRNIANVAATTDALNRVSTQFQQAASLGEKHLIAAQLALEIGHTGKPAWSAASKLLWHVKPEGWTMYDSFGRSGARTRSFDAFYTKLRASTFEIVAANFRTQLADPRHVLDVRIAERIIDWRLMMLGGRNSPCDGPDWVKAYLANQTPQTHWALHLLACDIGAELLEFEETL